MAREISIAVTASALLKHGDSGGESNPLVSPLQFGLCFLCETNVRGVTELKFLADAGVPFPRGCRVQQLHACEHGDVFHEPRNLVQRADENEERSDIQLDAGLKPQAP